MVKVSCLGAAQSVTGSNFLVETSRGAKIVVDCGLFQGNKEMERRNWQPWAYDPKEIKNLLLTHAHIDHSGRIPKIVKDGFGGKIITSPPTAELCEVMLLDSAHVQEMDAEWQSRKRKRRAVKGIEPLYTTEDAEKSLQYLVPMERDQIFDIEPGIKGRFRNAGHILGSSILELWIEDQGQEMKIVFSGDLGKPDQLIVRDPFKVDEAHYLFLESTYGNRLHRDFEKSKEEFLEAIHYAISNNEKVVIPAFAVERTQEVLYLLGEFYRAGQLPDIPVFLDSPLAIKATEIFRRNRRYYDDAARAILAQGFDPLDMPNLKLTRSTKESIEINELNGSAIIISANGMCTAGRIKHHLKHNLWRDGASIVILGFQARGTTGRQIVEGAKAVTIFGEKVAVRAKVYTIGGFSAHADQAGLLDWVGNFAEKSRPHVFLIHGESFSSEALAAEIRNTFDLEVRIPDWKEVLSLDPRQPLPSAVQKLVLESSAREMESITTDMETDIIRLKESLSVEGREISEEELAQLGELQTELRELVEKLSLK